METRITHGNLSIVLNEIPSVVIYHNGIEIPLDKLPKELIHGDLSITSTDEIKKSKVDDEWINYLEDVINGMDIVKEGDYIKLDVTTSNERPIYAQIDLYRDNKKITSAGRDHRINFAKRGMNDEWRNRVKAAVDYIYDSQINIHFSKTQIVDDEWINYLEDVINGMDIVKEGDYIKMRVTYSNGKPACAFLDLYRDNKKITSAGRDYRVGFAMRGLKPQWRNRVQSAIEHIYEKINKKPKLLKQGNAEVILKGDIIKKASGSLTDILSIIE